MIDDLKMDSVYFSPVDEKLRNDTRGGGLRIGEDEERKERRERKGMAFWTSVMVVPYMFPYTRSVLLFKEIGDFVNKGALLFCFWYIAF